MAAQNTGQTTAIRDAVFTAIANVNDNANAHERLERALLLLAVNHFMEGKTQYRRKREDGQITDCGSSGRCKIPNRHAERSILKAVTSDERQDEALSTQRSGANVPRENNRGFWGLG
ncbi:MAG: hypothetical protein ACRD3T_05955 [Terriglobia bacterium]